MAMVVLSSIPAVSRGRAPQQAAGGQTLTHLLGISAVTHEQARYRARTSAAGATVQIEWSVNSDLSSSTLTSGYATLADDDNTGGEMFTGLPTDTTIYYSIVVDGVRAHSSPFPRFRTCPTPGVATSFVFAPVSCNRGAYGPGFESVFNENPRFIMHLGDKIYGNTSQIDLLRAGPDTTSLPPKGGETSYWQPLYHADSDYAMWICRNFWEDDTWDDHEFAINNNDGDYPTKAVNFKVWKEYAQYFPLENPASGTWHKFTFAHCEFFVLDVRYQREGSKERWPSGGVSVTPNASSSGSTLVVAGNGSKQFNNAFRGWYYKNANGVVERVQSSTWDAGTSRHTIILGRSVTDIASLTFHLRNASMLDMDFIANGQTEWLINAMNASTAVFKFFCTPTPFHPNAAWSDSWGAWDVDQMELLYIRQHVTASNVIVLAGDRHLQAIDEGTNTGIPNFAGWPEVISSRWTNDATQLNGTVFSHGANLSTDGYVIASVTPTTVTFTGKRSDGVTLGTITPLTVTAV